MSGIARESMRFDVGGYYTLRGGESWGLLRCHHYRSRPSQADQLHLDVWWRGQNILRDSGSFQYYDPPRDRGAYFASTMAHNTLVVGGVSQMRKRSRFRWCSLAGGRLVHFGEGRDAGHIEVEHSGYRVSVGAVHRRCVVLLDEDVWLIVDEVSGSVAAGVDALWHLPDVPVSTEGQVAVVHTQAGPFSLRMTSDRSLGMRMERGGEGATMWGWDSEYYGELKPSPVLIGSITGLPTIVGTLVVLGSDESGDIALGGDVVRVVVGRREWLLRRSGRGPGEESPALMGIRN
jgi:asparagine synthase (glutamine-hydrolysing)